MTVSPQPAVPRLCAVIFNPVKVSAGFRDACGQALSGAGYEPWWLETTRDDPGQWMTGRARAENVDLVIAAGGDGTVRAVADGLAGSGISLGIVPAGTANLLADNLGLPTTQSQALATALTGEDRRIDLVAIVVDDGPRQHFAVMGGAGLDAMIMDETNEELKTKIGTAAYFLAAGKAIGRVPMKAKIIVDDHHIHRRRAILIMAGNVGRVHGLTVVPGAKPDDGLFDLVIASPRSPLDWLKAVGRLITRRHHGDDLVEIHQARTVTVQLGQPDTYQLDGDPAGRFTTMRLDVAPGALVVRVPADGERSTATCARGDFSPGG